MGDAEATPPSPPLSRGAYNINFDELDLDAIDPFKPRGGLLLSPTKAPSNPFQSKSKIASSPPLPRHAAPVTPGPVEEDICVVDEPEDFPPPPPPEEEVNGGGNSQIVDDEVVLETVTSEASVSDPIEIVSNENPFQSKNKLGQSPPNLYEENPFQTKSKIAESPKSYDISKDMKPFQSNSKMGRSPPDGNEAPVIDEIHNGACDNVENTDIDKPANESQKKSNANKGLKTKAKTKIMEASEKNGENLENGQGCEEKTKTAEKKTPSPKKSGIKKPKARSKFKPPTNFGIQDTGDVVIFAPPPPNSTQIASNEDQPMIEDVDTETANQMTVSELVGRAGGMIDSVHDFGAADMPEESNEAITPASDVFSDEQGWDAMEPHENTRLEENSFKDSVPEVPDKVTPRRVSEAAIQGQSEGDDDETSMTSPPPQKPAGRSVARHPASRALQQQLSEEGMSTREATLNEKPLFMPGKGETIKPYVVGEERYFDAPEFPQAGRKAAQADGAGERMSGTRKVGGESDNIVQLVQDVNCDDYTSDQVLKYSQSDWNKMRQDLELEFNTRLLNKEREWSKKLADRDKKIAYLDEQVLLLRSANEDMKCVVTEFEKTIAQLQADKLKKTTESQQTFEEVVKERDQALDDLQSVETAFSELHQRYERTKGVVEGFKKNEDILKKCVQDYQSKLKTAEEKTEAVIQQAEDKLARASDDMEKLRRSTTTEVARLEAGHKKAELKIAGLQKSLEQKIQENAELTAICDELIAKVGD
ncbi:transforming acidic coiled-coil-containing protein 1-like isoform X2 [Mya arenaria]|uniref:transforming acidic coiled-coil-containing protein 1-like isoform X2 n=1 Tax=Mya arenaria TaxID=6604 RepID=UPI0022E6242B|nr:transforming acidic coiled-coil-containing protein 1-like isoform X2 [Mya arenaria]